MLIMRRLKEWWSRKEMRDKREREIDSYLNMVVVGCTNHL